MNGAEYCELCANEERGFLLDVYEAPDVSRGAVAGLELKAQLNLMSDKACRTCSGRDDPGSGGAESQ
jgi:hypothetical protein